MKVDVALPCMPFLVQTRAADYLQLVRPGLALLRKSPPPDRADRAAEWAP